VSNISGDGIRWAPTVRDTPDTIGKNRLLFLSDCRHVHDTRIPRLGHIDHLKKNFCEHAHELAHMRLMTGAGPVHASSEPFDNELRNDNSLASMFAKQQLYPNPHHGADK
jgi:hypothetical protein